MGTFVLPYLWKDTETMLRRSTAAWRHRRCALWDKGFKVVGWWDNGFRHISNNKRPIRVAEDIKGSSCAQLPTKIHVTFWRALGASPTPMDWRRSIPRCSRDVVDGQENPPGVVFFEKLPDVQTVLLADQARERAGTC